MLTSTSQLKPLYSPPHKKKTREKSQIDKVTTKEMRDKPETIETLNPQNAFSFREKMHHCFEMKTHL